MDIESWLRTSYNLDNRKLVTWKSEKRKVKNWGILIFCRPQLIINLFIVEIIVEMTRGRSRLKDDKLLTPPILESCTSLIIFLWPFISHHGNHNNHCQPLNLAPSFFTLIWDILYEVWILYYKFFLFCCLKVIYGFFIFFQ